MGALALIYCSDGNAAFRQIATECGWLNGARLPGTVHGGALYFADQEWKEPDRKKYMAALARHCPHMATVLDWEREEQWPEVWEWAQEAAQWVRQVVIIPKVSGCLDQIPESVGGAAVVLGYSVPTSYGASPVPLWEFARRPVHLLGGSPHRQMELTGYLNVVSVDGSMTQQQSRAGRFWRRERGSKGHWIQLSEIGVTLRNNAHHEAFRRSCINIRATWEQKGFSPCAAAPTTSASSAGASVSG